MKALTKNIRDHIWDILSYNKRYHQFLNDKGLIADGGRNQRIKDIVSVETPDILTDLIIELQLTDYLIAEQDFIDDAVKLLSVVRIIDDFPLAWERSLQIQKNNERVIVLIAQLTCSATEIKRSFEKIKKGFDTVRVA